MDPDWMLTRGELDAWKPSERKPPTAKQQKRLKEMDEEAALGMEMSLEEYRNRYAEVSVDTKLEAATRQKEAEGRQVNEMKRQAGLGVAEPPKPPPPPDTQGPAADDPTMVGAMIGGLKLSREAFKSLADMPGAAPLWAAGRGGLKDLQEVVLRPLPDSMSTTSEPGGIASPLQLEVYQQKHPEGVNVHGHKPGEGGKSPESKKRKGPSV